MNKKLILAIGIALSTPLSVSAQVVPANYGENPDVTEEYRMPIPPMASGRAFPRRSGSEERSNYLSTSVQSQVSYSNNLIQSGTAQPVSDTGFRIRPMLTYDRMSDRLHFDLDAASGIMVYRHVSARNLFDQTAAADGEYRFTPHTTLSFGDQFGHSDSVFGQPFTLLGEPVSGSLTPSVADNVNPATERETNFANMNISYQPNRVALIGVGGGTTLFRFPGSSTSQVYPGSNSRSGSAFYSRRVRGMQFTGITYQYSDIRVSGSTSYAIHTQSILPFYLFTVSPSLTVMLACGPQAYSMNFAGYSSPNSWTPTMMGNVNWQLQHSVFSASASRSISGGGGILGAQETLTGNATIERRFARAWSGQASGGYHSSKNVADVTGISVGRSGHSVMTGGEINYIFNPQFSASANYEWMHWSYASAGANVSNPNSDQISVSVYYHFSRSIGR